jgi:hypothetical protein
MTDISGGGAINEKFPRREFLSSVPPCVAAVSAAVQPSVAQSPAALRDVQMIPSIDMYPLLRTERARLAAELRLFKSDLLGWYERVADSKICESDRILGAELCADVDMFLDVLAGRRPETDLGTRYADGAPPCGIVHFCREISKRSYCQKGPVPAGCLLAQGRVTKYAVQCAIVEHSCFVRDARLVWTCIPEYHNLDGQAREILALVDPKLMGAAVPAAALRSLPLSNIVEAIAGILCRFDYQRLLAALFQCVPEFLSEEPFPSLFGIPANKEPEWFDALNDNKRPYARLQGSFNVRSVQKAICVGLANNHFSKIVRLAAEAFKFHYWRPGDMYDMCEDVARVLDRKMLVLYLLASPEGPSFLSFAAAGKPRPQTAHLAWS